MPYIIVRGNLASYDNKYPWRVLVSGLKCKFSWFRLRVSNDWILLFTNFDMCLKTTRSRWYRRVTEVSLWWILWWVYNRVLTTSLRDLVRSREARISDSSFVFYFGQTGLQRVYVDYGKNRYIRFWWRFIITNDVCMISRIHYCRCLNSRSLLFSRISDRNVDLWVFAHRFH